MITQFKIFDSLNIKPVNNEIYLTQNLNYANSYAMGYKNNAHPMDTIENGVIFVIWLDENIPHFGGDIWKSFEEDVKKDLIIYKSTDEMSNLLENIFSMSYYEPTEIQIEEMIENPEKLLQSLSPNDWSDIQEREIGYSEIVLKKVSWEQIIEIRIFKDCELINLINGGYKKTYDEIIDDSDENYKNIFYHGSPLYKWEKKLEKL